MTMAMNPTQTIGINEWPSLLTTREVATILRVSTSTIEKLIHNGHVVSIKIGPRLHRIPKNEVQQLLTLDAGMNVNK